MDLAALRGGSADTSALRAVGPGLCPALVAPANKPLFEYLLGMSTMMTLGELCDHVMRHGHAVWRAQRVRFFVVGDNGSLSCTLLRHSDPILVERGRGLLGVAAASNQTIALTAKQALAHDAYIESVDNPDFIGHCLLVPVAGASGRVMGVLQLGRDAGDAVGAEGLTRLTRGDSGAAAGDQPFHDHAERRSSPSTSPSPPSMSPCVGALSTPPRPPAGSSVGSPPPGDGGGDGGLWSAGPSTGSSPGPFDGGDVYAAQVFTRAFLASTTNCQVLSRLALATQRIQAIVHSAGRDDVLDRAVQCGTQVIGCREASILLFDGLKQELFVKATFGGKLGASVALGKSAIINEAVKTCRTVNVPQVASSSWAKLEAGTDLIGRGVESVMYVPLMDIKGRCLGCIEFIDKMGGPRYGGGRRTSGGSLGGRHPTREREVIGGATGSVRRAAQQPQPQPQPQPQQQHDGHGPLWRVPPGFTREDEFNGSLLATTVASVLRVQVVYEAAMEWRMKVNAMFRISRLLNEKASVTEIMQLMMKEVGRLLYVDKCTVFLLDETSGELWSKVTGEKKEIRFPATQGIAGWCVLTGEVVNIKEAYDDHRFNKDIDAKFNYRTKTILAVPMKDSSGGVFGCMQAINRMSGGHFTHEDVQLMKAFCAQTEIAIENSRSRFRLAELQNLIVVHDAANTVADYIFDFDKDGKIVHCSPDLDLFGVTREWLMQRSFRDWLALNEPLEVVMSRVLKDPHAVMIANASFNVASIDTLNAMQGPRETGSAHSDPVSKGKKRASLVGGKHSSIGPNVEELTMNINIVPIFKMYTLNPTVQQIRMFCSRVELKEAPATVLQLTEKRELAGGVARLPHMTSTGLSARTGVVVISVLYDVEEHHETEFVSQIVGLINRHQAFVHSLSPARIVALVGISHATKEAGQLERQACKLASILYDWVTIFRNSHSDESGETKATPQLHSDKAAVSGGAGGASRSRQRRASLGDSLMNMSGGAKLPTMAIAKIGTAQCDAAVGVTRGEIAVTTDNMYNYYKLDNSTDRAKALATQARSWSSGVVMDGSIVQHLDQSFLSREIAIKLDPLKMQQGVPLTTEAAEELSFNMYELIGLFDSFNGAGVTALQKALPLFNRAVELYKAQNWTPARQAFKDVIDIAEDTVSRIYVERCEFFEAAQVTMSPQWNGLWDENYKALILEVFAYDQGKSMGFRPVSEATGTLDETGDSSKSPLTGDGRTQPSEEADTTSDA